jgi:hypothetical protein
MPANLSASMVVSDGRRDNPVHIKNVIMVGRRYDVKGAKK